jgi:hypothetical protein
MPWPERFEPPAPAATEPLLNGLVRALGEVLGGLFGEQVQVLPANPDEVEAFAGVPGAALAAVLLARRLGGGALPGNAGQPVGAVWRRQLAEMLDVVRAGLPAWPAGLGVLWVHATVAGVEDMVRLEPPSGAGAVPVRAEDERLGRWLAALVLPVRVELAGGAVPLAGVWPVAAGRVLPLNALPEVRLRLGDHVIGTATLEALPDGRQAATIARVRVTMGDEA